MMILLPGPAGSCPVCATEHADNQPHNQTSLYYQTRFFGLRGRCSTWADAMAHCDDRTRAQWRAVLVQRGEWSEPPAGVELIADPPHDALRELTELVRSEPVVVRIAE